MAILNAISTESDGKKGFLKNRSSFDLSINILKKRELVFVKFSFSYRLKVRLYNIIKIPITDALITPLCILFMAMSQTMTDF